MPRTKVKMAFITNDSARRAAFRKRKKGILKKVEELSTLCGVEACAIIYGPNDPEPEVWPSDHQHVKHVVEKLRSMSEWEQNKKMTNQRTLLEQMIVKRKEQLRKLVKDNREKEMTLFMYQCLHEAGKVLAPNNDKIITINADGLDALSSIVAEKLEDITKRLETWNQTPHQLQLKTNPFMDFLNVNNNGDGHETTTVPPVPPVLGDVANDLKL